MNKRYKHNKSRVELTTWDPGELVPINLMEITPGSSIQASTDAVIRALPLLAPVMHEVEIIITHAYIPHRLVWDDWEDFITGGDDGLNASTLPTIDFSGSPVAKGDLANYLGLPIGFDSTASALPFRAYSLFWNDHIYDEELQTELTIDTTSGADTTTNTSLKNVNWSKDRFTGSHANEQLGTAVTLPLGTKAPLVGIGIEGDNSSTPTWVGTSDLQTSQGTHTTNNIGSGNIRGYGGATPVDTNDPWLYADLTNASSATINELREAIALQKFAEMRQLYGSTYEKLLQADFDVRPRDGRMGNTEILSTARGLLSFSEVLATAETGTSVDVGDMKGHGIAAMRSRKFRTFFPEFGYLLSMVAVRPKGMYSQGVPRHYLKSTKEDFFNPHLQNMGMQAIQNREVKYDHTTPGGTFSNEPRYNEYRNTYNAVRGDFTDSSLNYWHFGRELSGDPANNSTFITCSPTQRVFAQSTTDNLLGMFKHKVAERSLVKKSVKPVGLI